MHLGKRYKVRAHFSRAHRYLYLSCNRMDDGPPSTAYAQTPYLESFCYTATMSEVVTILEANVEESNWKLLEETYLAETKNIPESIKQTLLIQSQQAPQKWRIVTHWRSQEDLDHMRATEAVPPAIRIFRTAKATPNLEIWNSKVHHLGPELR